MNYWEKSPNKVKQSIITLADGINQAVESLEIKDSQCVTSMNVDSSIYPTLQVVEGCSLLSQHTGYINHITKFKNEWYCGNETGMYKLSGTSWVGVYEYGYPNQERLWDSAMFFDGSKLYFLDGALPLQQYDGTTLTTISSAPARSSLLTTHANRFYLASTLDNLLSYSGLRDATDWTSTNKYTGTGKITVETPDGEKPTGLSQFSNHVLLFKKYTMHKLFGEDSTNFSMTQPYGVGCISDRSIVSTRDSLYWLGPDGFYDYMGGAAPVKISEPIKPYIESINMNYARHCCSGTDGRFIYLSLVTGASTLPNVTLKYDIQGGRWWPVNFVATSYYLDGQDLYFGTADGKIMKMGGETINGVQFDWYVVTKPYVIDETSRGAIHKLWIVADIESGSTFVVEYAGGTEGGAWTQVYASAFNTGRVESIRIPVIVRTPEFWYRLKLSGTGRMKLHRIIREVTRRGS